MCDGRKQFFYHCNRKKEGCQNELTQDKLAKNDCIHQRKSSIDCLIKMLKDKIRIEKIFKNEKCKK